MTYPYTRRDLLEEPEFYNYSEYRGEQFLEDFREHRGEVYEFVTEQLEQEILAGPQPVECLSRWSFLLRRHKNEWEDVVFEEVSSSDTEDRTFEILEASASAGMNAVSSRELLTELVVAQATNKTISPGRIRKWMNRFIRQFETSRFLRVTVNETGDFSGEKISDPTPYILLGIASYLMFKRDRHLKPLNTGLKVVDLLCSRRQTLDSTEPLILMKTLLLEEIRSLEAFSPSAP